MRLRPERILDVHPEGTGDDERRQSGGAKQSQSLGSLGVAIGDA
jgi:hypothetical protein